MNIIKVKELLDKVSTNQANQVAGKAMTGSESAISRLDRILSSAGCSVEMDSGSSETKLFKHSDFAVKITEPGKPVDRRDDLDEEIFCISRNTPLTRRQERFKVIVQDYRHISAAILENTAINVMIGYRYNDYIVMIISQTSYGYRGINRW